MTNYTKVQVITKQEEGNAPVPDIIKWTDGREFKIERILYVSAPEDNITAYTVLIGNNQRRLFNKGTEWRVSRL